MNHTQNENYASTNASHETSSNAGASASAVPETVATTTASATSSVNDFYFDSLTADYYLTRDANRVSHLDVVEEFIAIFPNYQQNHGFNRLIPYTFNDGMSSALPASGSLEFSVTRNGKTENINNITAGNGYFEYQIGDPALYVTGKQDYVINYRFENVINNQSVTVTQNNATSDVYPPDSSTTQQTLNFQELYWDAMGGDSAQSFNSVNVRLHLDEASRAAYNDQVACYVGKYGTTGTAATERCTIVETDDGFEFSAAELDPYEALTFAVGFDADTFVVPVPQYNYFPLIGFFVAIILGLLSSFVVLRLLAAGRVNRKNYKNRFVKPEYTPPRQFTVGEMSANYLGKRAKGSPLVATLLELAVTHKIELINTGDKKSPWQIRTKVPSRNLTCTQSDVLRILAGSTNPIDANQEIVINKHPHYSAGVAALAQEYHKDAKQQIQTKKLRLNSKTPTTVVAAAAVAGITPFALLFALTILVSTICASTPEALVVGLNWIAPGIFIVELALLAINLAIVSYYAKYQNATELGLEYSNYMEGLYLYISMAEAERLQFLQSVDGADVSHNGIVKLYEKLLPYASLFGLEKSWLKEMSHYYEYQDVVRPEWYLGATIATMANFDQDIRALTSAAGTSIAHSAPQSSSSSGSGSFGGGGGGGFSGGGGGGGGTSGW